MKNFATSFVGVNFSKYCLMTFFGIIPSQAKSTADVTYSLPVHYNLLLHLGVVLRDPTICEAIYFILVSLFRPIVNTFVSVVAGSILD